MARIKLLSGAIATLRYAHSYLNLRDMEKHLENFFSDTFDSRIPQHPEVQFPWFRKQAEINLRGYFADRAKRIDQAERQRYKGILS